MWFTGLANASLTLTRVRLNRTHAKTSAADRLNMDPVTAAATADPITPFSRTAGGIAKPTPGTASKGTMSTP
jgi:hypothetical protein